MNVVFLCLGGNLQDRSGSLRKARELITRQCGKITVKSGLYETEAWGSKSKRKFLNQVIQINSSLGAESLMKRLLRIEALMGRSRSGRKNADRVIDIDILFFGDQVIKTEQLQIPHPRLASRRFVLVPLCEIAPSLKHPVLGSSIRVLLKRCQDRLAVHPYKTVNLPSFICIEGNIGSGKTSLARVLQKRFKAKFLEEDYGEMRLLPLFYGKPKLYAFSLEFSFLLSRFEKMSACFEKNPGRVVSDYSIYKSLVFGLANLEAKELRLFRKQYETILLKLPEPGLIIHLNTDTKHLLNNISKRGRPYEQGITSRYLKKLERSYATVFSSLKHIPQLHISVDRYHSGLENEHVQRIEHFILENFG
ncbi:MAG TPA: 2-amino-4-hydroxy-6-hydroxymethyldihydropteridine diphosphokinase [Bacteroidia bacterium]|nr:2-amino-4-hydroxy-6-hydroxymethyldihydropteridine diphosphokinase [Bacteroidia bacterium]